MRDIEIISEARTWVGTPFHHQGRVKGVGVDCAGVIVGVARDLDILNHTFIGYGREPSNGKLGKELEKYCDRIKEKAPGCILLMRFKTEPQHLAIYTDRNTIIHAYQNIGRCIEHTLDEKWKRRVVSCWSYK